MENPLERNWIELAVLEYLNSKNRAVEIYHLRSRVAPGKEETAVHTIFALRDEGLLNVFEMPGGKMVEITPSGKAALLEVLTAHRHKCE